jgi:hypothetical protein
MPGHRFRHPTPVEGCNPCRWASVGVQTNRMTQGSDPVQRHPVIAEEGPRAGRVSGWHTEHWDGRQDATVTPSVLRLKTQVANTEEP